MISSPSDPLLTEPIPTEPAPHSIRSYVALESVQKLHSYYPGSELRMVSGGHVSAFLMHQVRACMPLATRSACIRALSAEGMGLCSRRALGPLHSCMGRLQLQHPMPPFPRPAFRALQDHFRQAILDSMQRLEKPAPQPTGNSSGQLSQPQPAQP